jgi:hypothetical protein
VTVQRFKTAVATLYRRLASRRCTGWLTGEVVGLQSVPPRARGCTRTGRGWDQERLHCWLVAPVPVSWATAAPRVVEAPVMARFRSLPTPASMYVLPL